ncbi:hypothetical protein B7988_06885 [Fibrobacter sp. UWB1]|uniref:LicD family protein n=1 Tax=Fibrobacter sp. UWB1 TaxID=1964355 RepID=UPI000B522E37|nr:LicD family protein [Fibrobacter sp. UWB1]OWV26303.1 hypothetical protein B7988_06885 [Fibrobacter sp. UWB1]
MTGHLEIREIREILLDMLKEVDSFCRKNSLNYSVAFGTLLGAIRHKGFIPWDDDIDILLPREDYEKFKRIFRNERYEVKYFDKDNNVIYPFAKVVDTKTLLKENISDSPEMGIYIDVFPVDSLPSNRIQQYLFQAKKSFLNAVYTLKIVNENNQRSFLKNAFLRISHVVLKRISWKTILESMERASMTYDKRKCTMKGILVPLDNRLREVVNKSVFDDYVDVPFEFLTVKAVKKYDEYLHALFGDYMKLPPKEKQITHHDYNVTWR